MRRGLGVFRTRPTIRAEHVGAVAEFLRTQEIGNLAGRGKLDLSIGRTVKLDEAVALIGELEAGRRTKGKAVIVMG